MIEYTIIPLDTSECITPTCEAIMELVEMTDLDGANCTTNDACDGVDCVVELSFAGTSFMATATAVVKPCNKPKPAVTISIASTEDGNVFYRVTISESTEITDIPTVVINVTVIQYNDRVGFEVGYHISPWKIN